MGAFIKIFIVLACINLMITVVGNATGTLNMQPLDEKAKIASGVISTQTTDAGIIATVNGEVLGSTNPENFTVNTAATGDANSQYRFIDPLKTVTGWLKVIGGFFIAPILMANALNFPGWLTSLVAVPMSLLFIVSTIMLIRGVSD